MKNILYLLKLFFNKLSNIYTNSYKYLNIILLNINFLYIFYILI